MSRRLVGIEFNRSLVAGLGAFPIPVVVMEHQRQRGVRLSQRIIQFKRLFCRGFSFGHGFARRQEIEWRDSQQSVSTGQTCIRWRVLWIFGDSSLKALNAFLDGGGGHAMKVISSFSII